MIQRFDKCFLKKITRKKIREETEKKEKRMKNKNVVKMSNYTPKCHFTVSFTWGSTERQSAKEWRNFNRLGDKATILTENFFFSWFLTLAVSVAVDCKRISRQFIRYRFSFFLSQCRWLFLSEYQVERMLHLKVALSFEGWNT